MCYSKKFNYHVCVMLSRLRGTWTSITFKVSHRRDNIRQIRYLDSLRNLKNSTLLKNVCIFKVLKRVHIPDNLYCVKNMYEKKQLKRIGKKMFY